MWSEGSNYQKLSIRNIRVQIRLGVLELEKTRPQTVEVDVELSRRYDGYKGEGLDDCIDYAPVYHYVTKEWPKRDHVDLIEAWAEDLIGHCMRDQKVEACRVRLRKIEIFSGTAAPEIEMVRYR